MFGNVWYGKKFNYQAGCGLSVCLDSKSYGNSRTKVRKIIYVSCNVAHTFFFVTVCLSPKSSLKDKAFTDEKVIQSLKFPEPRLGKSFCFFL